MDDSSVSSMQSLDGDGDGRLFTMQRDASLDRYIQLGLKKKHSYIITKLNSYTYNYKVIIKTSLFFNVLHCFVLSYLFQSVVRWISAK